MVLCASLPLEGAAEVIVLRAKTLRKLNPNPKRRFHSNAGSHVEPDVCRVPTGLQNVEVRLGFRV